MQYKLFSTIITLLFYCLLYGQTKASGTIQDKNNTPIAYATVYFQNSVNGILTEENGSFYLESTKKHDTLIASFTGYKDKKIPLSKSENFDLKITLEEDNELKEIVIYTGKTSKKNNPALDILRKIWENKKKNGLYKYNQYSYNKYEKVEFDLNSIDSAYMKSKLFKGMEFIFQYIDTSNITGKTYLPIFINEQATVVYGDNKKNLKKEIILGNKNSGFNNNQHIAAFIKDLYVDYDIYQNYIKLFDKDFTSPLSRTGIEVYNYVLNDTITIDDKKYFNIIFYPRRKGGLTFKGDFWVNENTWAIKKITMNSSEGMNINWVKNLYIEQEFESISDSVFLLKKDVLMSDFALNQKEKSKGVYGKRITYFNNFQFDIEKPTSFYHKDINKNITSSLNREDTFWEKYRAEELSKNEKNIYKMLDQLQENNRFQSVINLSTIAASGYWPMRKWDYGPIFSTFGFNDVEGIRIRTGGRTYFGQNDLWRIEGYTAYGLKDNKFKYGISTRWSLDKNNRLIFFAGNRRDVEQIAASLSPITDVLGRSYASSALLASGDNSKLTNINLSSAGIEIEPIKNLKFSTNITYKTLKSASHTFSLAYQEKNNPIQHQLKQTELNLSADFTPKRKTIGYGVDRTDVDLNYARLFVNYSVGVKDIFNSHFDYKKIQFLYRHPIIVGGLGRFTPTIEAGKTFGTVPLALLSIIPGNQSYFGIENAFNQLDYYEFITDQYLTFHLEHNFNGKLFSRIPTIRKWNLREIIGFRGAWGDISTQNIAINRSNIAYKAPNQQIYYEYYFGIGNIFKLLRIDANWRGNYLENPNARKFGIKATFGFHF